jgi:hypothetical protein
MEKDQGTSNGEEQGRSGERETGNRKRHGDMEQEQGKGNREHEQGRNEEWEKEIRNEDGDMEQEWGTGIICPRTQSSIGQGPYIDCMHECMHARIYVCFYHICVHVCMVI